MYKLTARTVYYVELWQMSADCDITLTVSMNGTADQPASDEIAVQGKASFTDEEPLSDAEVSEKDGFSSESDFESEAQGTVDSSEESAELENSVSEEGFAGNF